MTHVTEMLVIVNVHTIETLGLSLLKAVAHIGTHPEGAEDKAIKLLCEFVEIIENGLRSTEKDELGKYRDLSPSR